MENIALFKILYIYIYIYTVADKKIPVSVAFNAVLFPFRWRSVSVLNFPFTFSVGVAVFFPFSLWRLQLSANRKAIK